MKVQDAVNIDDLRCLAKRRLPRIAFDFIEGGVEDEHCLLANESSFARYIADMAAACAMKGVVFRYATDVTAVPQLLAPFDRIVIASGAAYRLGIGLFADWMLDHGVARAPGLARLFAIPALRDWFYYRARRSTARRFEHLAAPGQIVTVIGDAVRAGKSKQAITSAFEAALLR